MKRTKRLWIFMVIIGLCVGIVGSNAVYPLCVEAKGEKYWLTGYGFGDGGNCSVKYANGMFTITGDWGKASKYLDAANAYYDSSRKAVNMTVPKSKNCKFIIAGGDGSTVKPFTDSTPAEEGPYFDGLGIDILIKNDRVVKYRVHS